MQRIIVLTSLILLALAVGTSGASAIDAGLVSDLANGTIVLK